MQVGQFANVTLSVAGADADTDADVAVAVPEVGADVDVVRAGVEVAGTRDDVMPVETLAERLAAVVPATVGRLRAELVVLAGPPAIDATADDTCASCGTVTTTVAPAGAATWEAVGDALTAADESAPDVEVDTVHPARPAASNAAVSGAHRHAGRPPVTLLIHCSYTRAGAARGTPGGRPAAEVQLRERSTAISYGQSSTASAQPTPPGDLMSRSLATRPWTPDTVEDRVRAVSQAAAGRDGAGTLAELQRLAAESHRIHDVDCINLNPATNVMNPKAEAFLAAGLGSRPSLGYPADKYETGLEAIEQIEIIAAELAAEVFDARYAEVRVSAGAQANLYAFMATCRPGDVIIAPPPSVGGHVTHDADGAAGLYGLSTVPAPVDAGGYSIDVDALRDLAHEVRPRLITVGGSLNLFPHPVSEVRQIADEVGATVLFDAAHLCGMIAGRAWPNPLSQGAHLMTMSTYKSLGGPAGGLVVTNDAALAQRLDAIAYPGMTANFDAGRTAALAVTLADWKAVGQAYASTMVSAAQALAAELDALDVPIFAARAGYTRSHQFAVLAARYGGGQRAARLLRRANLLACGIGLPVAPVDGDLNGLRIGTPELARIGMTAHDMPTLASFVARGLDGDDAVAADVTRWRAGFTGVHFVAS